MLRPQPAGWLRWAGLLCAEIGVVVWLAPVHAQEAAPGADADGPRVVARLGEGHFWHGAAIRALALSADEKTLASYGADNRIALWDLATGKLRGHLTLPVAALPEEAAFAKARVAFTLLGNTLQFSGDGSVLAALDSTGRQAILWQMTPGDSAAGRLLHQIPLRFAEEDVELAPGFGAAALNLKRAALGPMTLSRDGKHVILAGAKDHAIVILEPGRKEPLARLQGHEAPVLALAVSPDGKALLSAGEDQTVRLWDLERHKHIDVFPGHRAPVAEVAFAPDGKRFLSAATDGVVLCRDRASGQLLARLAWKPAQIQQTPEGTLSTRQVSIVINNAWFEADGTVGCQFSVTAGSTISGMSSESLVRWDPATGKELSRQVYHSLGSAYQSAAAALAGPARPAAAVRTSAIGPVGGIIVRPTPSQHLQVASLADGALVAPSSPAHNSCADVEISGAMVALARQHDAHVYLWNWRTKQVRALVGHTAQPLFAGFSPDGKRLLSATHDPADRNVSVWDVAAGKELLQIPGWNPGAVGTHTTSSLAAIRAGGNASFRVPALSPDGRRVALRDRDGKLRVLDAGSGKEVARFDFAWKGEGAAAFTFDGKRLMVSDSLDPRRAAAVFAAAGKAKRDPVHSALHLFDVPAGQAIGQLNPVSYDFQIARIAIAGRSVLAACKDGSLRVIDRVHGRHVRDLIPSTIRGDEPNSVVSTLNRAPFFVMAPDQCSIAVRMPQAQLVRIVEVATGRERARFFVPSGTVQCMGFAPDGRHFVTGSEDGTALVWDLSPAPAAQIGDAEGLWTELAAEDAARAFRALGKLGADPAAAVKLCRVRLAGAALPAAADVQRKLQELDSPLFAVRQKAQEELLDWGEIVRPQLEKASDTPNISGEVKLRVDAILKKLDEQVPTGDRLRELRALELLERLGNADADAVLERLARSGGPLASQAESALARRKARSAR